MCRQFSLTPDEARAEAHIVAKVVCHWHKHFRATGVMTRDIDLLAEQIDRPFLREQRDELAGKSPD